jgi:hypothetical protein
MINVDWIDSGIDYRPYSILIWSLSSNNLP